MKKTFPLHVPGLADARVIEGIKHDVRKYVKRERRKALPEGFTEWAFACKVGATGDAAGTKLLVDVAAAIDEVALGGSAGVYVEILASPGHRFPAPPASTNP